jgi:hypothetical protein
MVESEAMASLSELVEIIAQVEGMDPATVGLIARNVREAELISKKGRGRSAAKMTLTDAANLLIAVNATVTVRESAQTLRIYRRLETGTTGFLDNNRAVHERVQLGRALEHLIEAASSGIFERFFLTTVPALIATDFRKEQVDIEFLFYKPRPYVRLEIYARSGYVLSSPPSYEALEEWERATKLAFYFELPDQIKRLRRQYKGDRIDTASIGFRTIRAVAKLLSG